VFGAFRITIKRPGPDSVRSWTGRRRLAFLEIGVELFKLAGSVIGRGCAWAMSDNAVYLPSSETSTRNVRIWPRRNHSAGCEDLKIKHAYFDA
jgi:hypothetical protein